MSITLTSYRYNLDIDFPNKKINTETLSDEINKSTITISLSHINISNSDVDIVFKLQLTEEEEVILDGIVGFDKLSQRFDSYPELVEGYNFHLLLSGCEKNMKSVCNQCVSVAK